MGFGIKSIYLVFPYREIPAQVNDEIVSRLLQIHPELVSGSLLDKNSKITHINFSKNSCTFETLKVKKLVPSYKDRRLKIRCFSPSDLNLISSNYNVQGFWLFSYL